MSIATQINDVIRRVRLDEAGAAVALERTFATSAADLWDACTNPDRLASWFEPVEGDLRPGGRYRLADSGTVGTVERCAPPSELRITWEYDGDVSQVTVTITPTADEGARLVLVHQGLGGGHWRTYGPAAGGVGWDSSLLALGLVLADDPRAAPEEMERWSSSPQGREFVEATAAAWQQEHRRAGADPVEAAEAARRTVAAYTDATW